MAQDKIQKVADILEIQALKATYCEICDTAVQDPKQLARLKDITTEDIKADYGMGAMTGREGITGFLSAATSNSDWFWHAIHTPNVEVTGETAKGSWTVIARTRPKGSSEVNVTIGRYINEFRRTSAGWRFSALRFAMEG